MGEPWLSDRVALVTGAASGIGRSVTERFISEGARVVALDRSREGLEELKRECGARLVAVAGDVRSWEENRRAVDAGVDAFGRLDVLVANAGVFDGSLPLEVLDAEALWQAAQEVFEINVFGYLLGVRACLDQLRTNRGSIVLTGSNASLYPGSGGGILYTASKHAVVGLVRQLAHELAPEVTVNGVCPGGTITGLRVAEALGSLVSDRRHFADAAAGEEAIRTTNALGVVPEPEDHAAAYVLLASKGGRVITGELISTDGGIGVLGLDFSSQEGA